MKCNILGNIQIRSLAESSARHIYCQFLLTKDRLILFFKGNQIARVNKLSSERTYRISQNVGPFLYNTIQKW